MFFILTEMGNSLLYLLVKRVKDLVWGSLMSDYDELKMQQSIGVWFLFID
jgi:hypothetical protein